MVGVCQMIKGVIILLFLSGESKSYDSEVTYPTVAACGIEAVETMAKIVGNPDIVGMAFTCEPAGLTG